MDFNKPKVVKIATQDNKKCGNCRAFFREVNDKTRGFCTLLPPQVVVAGDDVMFMQPEVDAELSRCEQHKFR